MHTNAAQDPFAPRTIQRTVCRDGLSAFEAAYAPNSQLPEHAHTSPFFTYVLRSEYVEEVARGPSSPITATPR